MAADPLDHYRQTARTLRHAVVDLRDAVRGMACAAEEWDPTGEQSDPEAEASVAAAAREIGELCKEYPAFVQFLQAGLYGLRSVKASGAWAGQVGEVPL